MNLYNHGISPEVVRIVEKIAQALDDKYPSEGVVASVDGSFADIRVGSSSTLYRHCPVIGDATSMIVGQTIGLRWVSGKPYVLASTLPTEVVSPQTYNPDNITLENSPYGIRVKPGALQLSHLAFSPSLEGHTHTDSLTSNGWVVDDDGTLHQNGVNIHPSGQISLGLHPNIIKLDANHATHRFWAGNVLPEYASFAITKEGAIKATAGEIAGWTILSDRLSKNGAELKASGELELGTGNNVAVLSASNVDGWRLWIGHATPASAPFRVNQAGEVWLENAHINSTLESTNYISGQQGWHIDNSGWAEFSDVTIRGSIASSTFVNAVTSVLSGRQIVTDGASFISDAGTTDTTIDVDAPVFEIDDILQCQPSSDRNEWMQVVNGPTVIEGGYRYEVTRDLAAAGAAQFYAGEAIFRKGNATYPIFAPMMGTYDMQIGGFDVNMGGGVFNTMGGFMTLEGSREWGPYIGVARRFGATYNQITDILRMGRLRGFLGTIEDEYGFGIGDANRHILYTYTGGLVIKTNNGLTEIDDSGITTDKFAIADGSAPTYVDGRTRIYLDLVNRELRARIKDGIFENDTLIADLSGAGGSHDHDDTYALIDHNHAGTYAAFSHTHPNYADATHNHDLDYSDILHHHDLDYSDINHNHDAAYASLGHNHSGVYSLVSHNHDAAYSNINHNHDADYSAIDHDHDLDYAALGHNHTGVYSPVSHTHSDASTTTKGLIEIATQTEVNTGTDTVRAVTPATLAALAAIKYRSTPIMLCAPGYDCEVGEKYRIEAPQALIGYKLVDAKMAVTAVGTTGSLTVSVEVYKSGTWYEMFSTLPTVGSGNWVDNGLHAVNTSYDALQSGDFFRIVVDSTHTTPAQGVSLVLEWELDI